MTRARWTVLAPMSVVLVAALAGCGRSAAGNGETTSCTDTKTESGLTVDLTTTPCPIKGGQSATAKIAIKDSSGAAVKDASVKLITDMPSMNMHGGDQDVPPSGDGYETKVVLGMGGDWQIKVQVTRGSSAPTTATFQLNAK
jgi:hypothetical protein